MIEKVAKYCHETNKKYCESIGDFSQPSWKNAPDWMKKSVIDGVSGIINSKDMTPEQCHMNWMETKEKDGWKYGPVKDARKKEHPSMVPYNKLPMDQKFKDILFVMSVIVALENHKKG